jgi:hypothetical protein
MKDDPLFLENGRQLKKFGKWEMTSNFEKWKTTSILGKWKTQFLSGFS